MLSAERRHRCDHDLILHRSPRRHDNRGNGDRRVLSAERRIRSRPGTQKLQARARPNSLRRLAATTGESSAIESKLSWSYPCLAKRGRRGDKRLALIECTPWWELLQRKNWAKGSPWRQERQLSAISYRLSASGRADSREQTALLLKHLAALLLKHLAQRSRRPVFGVERPAPCGSMRGSIDLSPSPKNAGRSVAAGTESSGGKTNVALCTLPCKIPGNFPNTRLNRQGRKKSAVTGRNPTHESQTTNQAR